MNVSELSSQELHKPVIKKFKRRKVSWRFKDNICVSDLAESRSLSSKYLGVKYLLCVIYVFTNYAWIKPLKVKKYNNSLWLNIDIINESKHKPNKFWTDQWK